MRMDCSATGAFVFRVINLNGLGLNTPIRSETVYDPVIACLADTKGTGRACMK